MDTFYVGKQGGFLDGLIRDIEEKKAKEGADLDDGTVRVGFKRLSTNAIIPTKAHASDSGFDIYALEDAIIEPGETVIVPTGIAVELPKGYEAQVRPRSGVTSKSKLRVQLGTIDNGYTGEIGVIVDNINDTSGVTVEEPDDGFWLTLTISDEYVQTNHQVDVNSYLIRKGERIAQLVVQQLPEVVAVEIEEFTEDSVRGEGGYGSSGV